MRPTILTFIFTTLLAANVSAIDAPDPPAESTCTQPDIESAHERAKKALVRIESPDGIGLGFVFHSPEHVVTTFSLVDTGRGVEVVLSNGRRRSAAVVAYDETRDLAILKLARPSGMTPLKVSKEELQVGDPVLSIGEKSTFDKPETVIEPGIVSNIEDDHFKSEALESYKLTWGAPLLDCNGDVIGAAGEWSSDGATPADALAELQTEVAEEAVYDGDWSIAHPSLSFPVQIDNGPVPEFGRPNVWLGIGSGLALIGHDKWFFPMRVSLSGLVGPHPDADDGRRTGYRVQGEAGMGYRFMLSEGMAPVYLVPKVGMTLSYQDIVTTTNEDVGTCDASSCEDAVVEHKESSSLFHLMPTVGLGFLAGPGELSYQFQLDPESVDRSVHQITLGFQF
jgi:hypothetical protein